MYLMTSQILEFLKQLDFSIFDDIFLALNIDQFKFYRVIHPIISLVQKMLPSSFIQVCCCERFHLFQMVDNNLSSQNFSGTSQSRIQDSLKHAISFFHKELHHRCSLGPKYSTLLMQRQIKTYNNFISIIRLKNIFKDLDMGVLTILLLFVVNPRTG